MPRIHAKNSCQIEWEIVSISLMQHFHAEIGSVQNVLPAVDYVATWVQHALIEVQTIQVKGHCADAQSSKPNAYNWPHCQEEVECTGIVEGGKLEDQATKIAVRCRNAICFVFLTENVPCIEARVTRCLRKQGRSHE